MKLYEIHETSSSIHLIVELLSGGELFEKIKEKKNYKEKDCVIILKKMITPLIYLHSKGFMHRDLKPENLILRPRDNEYDIVIADFGLATEINTKAPLHIRCGTPGYCAPEILNSKAGRLDYDSKCDVFSLGCIFYHIVTGHNPFHAKNNKMLFYNNRLADVNFQHSKLAYLSETGNHIPKYFEFLAHDLMKLLLTKDPNYRPTFEEAIQHPFFASPVRRDVNNPVISQNRFSMNKYHRLTFV
jgi:serine/threonine protein kinase